MGSQDARCAWCEAHGSCDPPNCPMRDPVAVPDPAETIRRATAQAHTGFREVGSGEHAPWCLGCAADSALAALLVERQRAERIEKAVRAYIKADDQHQRRISTTALKAALVAVNKEADRD